MLEAILLLRQDKTKERSNKTNLEESVKCGNTKR
jgi:hypothetical protein